MKHVYKFPRPALTVDIMVITQIDDVNNILLIRRKNPPFKHSWALPGGFVDMDETLEEAASRELQEETGVEQASLQQFHTFGDLERDPRGRTVSVVYWVMLNKKPEVNAADDAEAADWFPLNKLPELAFDHQMILEKAIDQLNLLP